jgi:response regulator NasT
VADDEGVIRMGFREMLGSLGHKVVATARTGEEAIEKVKQFEPDVLLLDIKMPVMDGLTAAKILAAEAPLPIIMLTAYSQKELIERAVEALVMGYLVKPISENKLGPAIELALIRFAEMQAVAREAYKLRNQLEGRELVDAAKRILMATGLSEIGAYQRLQMAAREQRLPMREVAETIIAVGQRFVS